jgi:hypothetical protein
MLVTIGLLGDNYSIDYVFVKWKKRCITEILQQGMGVSKSDKIIEERGEYIEWVES